MKYMVLFISCLPLLLACEKVVDVDLNAAAPKLVIEGNITDQPGPYTVRLSKTVSYTGPNEFVPVSGATVTVSDNTGNTETLAETSPGIYQGDRLKGTPGRTYRLEVKTGDATYTASSVMPAAVMVDTLIQGEKNDFGDTKVVIRTWFHDPVGTEDYYRFAFSVNGVPSESIFTFDARLYDGKYVSYELGREDEEEEDEEGQGAPPIQAGDEVEVTLYHIDQPVYLYFLILQQSMGDGPPTAPGNPISNISNGALGYFSAYTLAKRVITIK